MDRALAHRPSSAIDKSDPVETLLKQRPEFASPTIAGLLRTLNLYTAIPADTADRLELAALYEDLFGKLEGTGDPTRQLAFLWARFLRDERALTGRNPLLDDVEDQVLELTKSLDILVGPSSFRVEFRMGLRGTLVIDQVLAKRLSGGEISWEKILETGPWLDTVIFAPCVGEYGYIKHGSFDDEVSTAHTVPRSPNARNMRVYLGVTESLNRSRAARAAIRHFGFQESP